MNENIKEYNKMGLLSHCKNMDGSEYWKEYDDDGNLIYYKDSGGYEEKIQRTEKEITVSYKEHEGKTWNTYTIKRN